MPKEEVIQLFIPPQKVLWATCIFEDNIGKTAEHKVKVMQLKMDQSFIDQILPYAYSKVAFIAESENLSA